MEFLPAMMLFAVSSAFTPGPNNIMMMASGLNFGVRKSLPHLLGVWFGVPTMVIGVGFGLGFLFQTYPLLHQLIKVLGILYLLYLAWLIANSAGVEVNDARAKPLTFIQAALFQWINPKGWVVTTSAIATFSNPESNIYLQVVIIAGVFLLFAAPATATWLCFGSVLQRVISHRWQQKLFNGVMALLLVVSITPIAYELIRQYLL